MIVAFPGGGLPCSPLLPVGCVAPAIGGLIGGGVGGVGAVIGGGIGGAAGAAAKGIFDVTVGYMADAVAWLTGHIVSLAGRTGDPDLTAKWFTNQLPHVRVVMEMAVAPLLMVATIGAVLKQDLKRLARIWGVGLPVAALVTSAAFLLARYALSFTDTLTGEITGPHGLTVAPALSHLSLVGLASGAPLLVNAAIYALAIIGAVFIWLELILRESAVYVVMFFMPLALVMYVWPASAVVAKRAVQTLVALILSKLVIFATISLGVAALSGSSPMDQQFAGAGILLLASFAPFALMKLAPIVEVAAIAHLEGMSRRPFRAAARASATVASPGNPVVRSLLASRSGRPAPDSAASVLPQPLAHRAPDYLISQDRPVPHDRPTDG